ARRRDAKAAARRQGPEITQVEEDRSPLEQGADVERRVAEPVVDEERVQQRLHRGEPFADDRPGTTRATRCCPSDPEQEKASCRSARAPTSRSFTTSSTPETTTIRVRNRAARTSSAAPAPAPRTWRTTRRKPGPGPTSSLERSERRRQRKRSPDHRAGENGERCPAAGSWSPVPDRVNPS